MKGCMPMRVKNANARVKPAARPVPDMATWNCPCGQMNTYGFGGSMKCCRCKKVWKAAKSRLDWYGVIPDNGRH